MKIVIGLLLLGAAAFGGQIQYLVNVNTTTAPSSGYLDFEFNPGDATSQAAFVTISGFVATVRPVLPVAPPSEAEIVVVPGLAAKATPLKLMLATVEFEEAHLA